MFFNKYFLLNIFSPSEHQVCEEYKFQAIKCPDLHLNTESTHQYS